MKTYSGIDPTTQKRLRIMVKDGIITELAPIMNDDKSKLPYILPALVDLQHNGSLGVYYNTLRENGFESLRSIANLLRQHGVGRCLLTLTTYPYDDLKIMCRELNKFLDDNPDLATLFFGIFHEGMFISPADGWRGAHKKEWIIPPDFSSFRELDRCTGNRIKVVNIAPEVSGALDFIEKAVEHGYKVSLGHCGPSAALVDEAVQRGASMVTHLGNGCPGTIHRFDNPLWAFLNNDKLKAGFIADGFHLPKDLLGTILKAKGPGNCFPVSDASGFAGCQAGNYTIYGDREFVIESNGYMHLKNSEILCGAWFQLDQAISTLINKLDVSFLEAWRLCSQVPADTIGIRLPELKVGQEASFILANWDGKLIIEQAIHCGQDYVI